MKGSESKISAQFIEKNDIVKLTVSNIRSGHFGCH